MTTVNSRHPVLNPETAAPAPSRDELAAIYATYVVRVHTCYGIKTLSFDTLAVFFPVPSKQAADEIGISSRTLIRACRSLGIRRWPYVRFRSEQNVARIRRDAIESLCRHLQTHSRGVLGTIEKLHPTIGASATRLLQVDSPELKPASPPRRLRDHPMSCDANVHDQPQLPQEFGNPTPYHDRDGSSCPTDRSCLVPEYSPIDLQRISPHKQHDRRTSRLLPVLSASSSEPWPRDQLRCVTPLQSSMDSSARHQRRTMSIRDILSSP